MKKGKCIITNWDEIEDLIETVLSENFGYSAIESCVERDDDDLLISLTIKDEKINLLKLKKKLKLKEDVLDNCLTLNEESINNLISLCVEEEVKKIICTFKNIIIIF